MEDWDIMLFDTHAHLDDGRFDEDRDALIKGLPQRGISYVLNAGASLDSSKIGIELAQKYDFIYAGVGVHPHDAVNLKDNDLNTLRELALKKKVVAYGEIGLDYYYDFSPRDIQRKRFDEQLNIAGELGLPVIIHNRDAHSDTLDILRANINNINGGVMHCYTGSWEMAKTILDLGLHIAIGGVVTFKNARKSVEVVENINMDYLLIETDCPYMTPVPYRGRRNDPGYVFHIAEKIAEIRGIDVEDVAKKTTQNALKLFNIEEIQR